MTRSKARSGLLALQAALRTPELAGDTALRMEMERVLAGAHEFQEMALLDALRRGVVTFRADELPDVERLLGGAGGAVTERVGLAPDAGAAEVDAALRAALARWQARAESPLSSRELADAARILVRTCEGFLAGTPG